MIDVIDHAQLLRLIAQGAPERRRRVELASSLWDGVVAASAASMGPCGRRRGRSRSARAAHALQRKLLQQMTTLLETFDATDHELYQLYRQELEAARLAARPRSAGPPS